MENVHELLHMLQMEVNAPKNKTNSFGGYNYRTAEGMLSAAKPHLPKGSHLTCRDEPLELCGKLVLKATATLYYLGETVSTTSFALHAFTRKGMDEAQISGSASSYAHKYALGGLLAIDDGTQDPDSKKPEPEPKPKMKPKPIPKILEEISKVESVDELTDYYKQLKSLEPQSAANQQIIDACAKKKASFAADTLPDGDEIPY
jgi:hypothetical protein